MGRKAKFDETKKVKKGPGRKARKQSDPIFRKELCECKIINFYDFLYNSTMLRKLIVFLTLTP